MNETGTLTPEILLDRWNQQQTGFIKYRTLKIEMMVDVIGRFCGTSPRVLDLACGPGSLTQFILSRTPDATVVAIDKDPILIAIAEDVYRNDHRVNIINANLDTRDWVDAVKDVCKEPFDAVVSATALHWLEPAVLTNVYTDLYNIMAEGGIFMNSDSLYYDPITKPAMRKLSDVIEREHESNSFGITADSWDDWWKLAESYPPYAEAAKLRKHVWAQERRNFPIVNLGYHLELLKSVGFHETSTIWQYFNDITLYAIR